MLPRTPCPSLRTGLEVRSSAVECGKDWKRTRSAEIQNDHARLAPADETAHNAQPTDTVMPPRKTRGVSRNR